MSLHSLLSPDSVWYEASGDLFSSLGDTKGYGRVKGNLDVNIINHPCNSIIKINKTKVTDVIVEKVEGQQELNNKYRFNG